MMMLLIQGCSIDATLEELEKTQPLIPTTVAPPTAPVSTGGRFLNNSLGSHYAIVEQGKTVSTGYSLQMTITSKEKKQITGGGYTIQVQ